MLDALVSWMTASLVLPMNGLPIRILPPARLERDGVAFGPVWRAHEVFADPQLASRRMTVEIDGPSGRSTFIRQPMLFDGAAGQVSRPVPQLGQHNADLLQRRPISVTSA